VARELGLPPERLAGLEPDLLAAIRARLEALEELAARDEVTGVLRRSAGLEQLEHEMARARRGAAPRLVIAFLDVDDLKAVNDSEGHAAGDRLLTTMAQTLRRKLRSYDLVIRWGGDEFVCVLPDAGEAAAERLLDDVSGEFTHQTRRSFSAGVASLQDGDTPQGLVERADVRLYATRRRRRVIGRWVPTVAVMLGAAMIVGAMAVIDQGSPLSGLRAAIQNALERLPIH